MNKKLKTIIIFLNFIMLIASIWWLYDKIEPEPIIVFVGQIVSLLVLFLENPITKKFEAGNLLDSELNVENKDRVKMKDITKSKVTVK
jgi:hypothetical protein